MDYLGQNAPSILNFYDSKAQKSKYKGEIYPSDHSVDESITSIELFQRNRLLRKKGIIGIDRKE